MCRSLAVLDHYGHLGLVKRRFQRSEHAVVVFAGLAQRKHQRQRLWQAQAPALDSRVDADLCRSRADGKERQIPRTSSASAHLGLLLLFARPGPWCCCQEHRRRLRHHRAGPRRPAKPLAAPASELFALHQ